ncbi:MAG: UDP-2,3-diacylglucosamine diphosphatase [Candidatus Kapaibacteriota bacterium]
MIYFISDIHLGYFPKEKNGLVEKMLIRLLDLISKDGNLLVIVGDLFDYWFDYRTVIPKDFFRVISKFDELLEKGVKIIYLIGNHDFGHYKFFEEELGIEIYRDDLEQTFYGKKFYISHGDGKIKNDWGYKLLKFILRNKVSGTLFRLIHPDIGIKLAQKSSRKSRNYTENRRNKDFDSLFEFAKLKIEQGYDYVVMGHSHRLEQRNYKNGMYINLGDWLGMPVVGIYDGKEFLVEPVEKMIQNTLRE